LEEINMPLPKGTRFRVKTTKTGKKIRLAFKKGTSQVIEVKKLNGEHTAHQIRAKVRGRKRR
jgi:hypothetical protein